MDTLPSAKFRKRYATLATDTLVTVNGHVIGRWVPIVNGRWEFAPEEPADALVGPNRQVAHDWERFNTRPFTPVPKK